MTQYILDGKIPVPEENLLKWGKWLETANRVVKKDRFRVKVQGKEVGYVDVSTVFLGLDHNFSGTGNPILFETMVFGGPLNGEQDRCATWEAAEKMHETMCERQRNAKVEL